MKKYLYYLLIISFALSCKVTKTKKVPLSTYVFEWRKQKTSIVFINDSTFRLENKFNCQNLPDKDRYYNNMFFFKKVNNNNKMKTYLTLLITKKLNPDTTKAPIILPYKGKGNCFGAKALPDSRQLFIFLPSVLRSPIITTCGLARASSIDSIVGIPVIKPGDSLFFFKRNKKHLYYWSQGGKPTVIMEFKKK